MKDNPPIEVFELSCNLDDMTGEDIGFAVETLLNAGALDVWTTPIYMKKNRPAVLLTCLCSEEDKAHYVNLIFKHTRTLGIRETPCRRHVLNREAQIRETPLGTVRIKIAHLPDGTVREKPEHDDLVKLAKANNISLGEVQQIIADGMNEIQEN